MNAEAHALYYASLGWSVFPAPIGTKKSHKSAKYSDGSKWGMTKDADEIRRDFNQFPGANVGIATGAVSGIFVVEADTKDGTALLTSRWSASFSKLSCCRSRQAPTCASALRVGKAGTTARLEQICRAAILIKAQPQLPPAIAHDRMSHAESVPSGFGNW